MKKSLSAGILLGITLVVAMGIVYIDNVKHYWQFSGGFVRLVVNTNTQASIVIQTNTGALGFNTNNTVFGINMTVKTPVPIAGFSGTDAQLSGGIVAVSGAGGNSTDPVNGGGGNGGLMAFTGGLGGTAPVATNYNQGGNGGSIQFIAGAGGGTTSVSTNFNLGGDGGSTTIQGGNGGVFSGVAATNSTGGSGGAAILKAGNGGTPVGGFSQLGGGGASATMTAGNSGNSQRNDVQAPGNASVTAGNSGNAAVSGNPQPGGTTSITGGNGGTGATNSNGGNVNINGGAPGSGAVPGNVVLARTRGGVQVGPFLGGSATLTNLLGASASLDFPSTAAGTVSDLPITVTGVTSNNCAVALSVAWQGAAGGGSFSTYSSNDSVYVRFVNNNLVTAIDPSPFTATVVVFRIR